MRIVSVLIGLILVVGCVTAPPLEEVLVGEWARSVDEQSWQQYTLSPGGTGAYFVCQGPSRCDVQQDVFWRVEEGKIVLRQMLDFDHAVEITSAADVSVGSNGTLVLSIENQDGVFWKQ